MVTAPDRVDDPTLADLLRRLVPAYRPERVYLFGSRACGEVGPDSDYGPCLHGDRLGTRVPRRRSGTVGDRTHEGG